MKKKYKWLLYGVYSVCVAAFFLYYLFPSETVKRYIIARINMSNPEVRVSIKDVAPILPPGLKLHSVRLGSRSEDLMDAEEVVLVPNLMSLFSDSPSYRFFIKAFGGSIEGRAQMANQTTPRGRIEIDANIADIRLEMAQIVRAYSGNRLEGICSGTIHYKKTPGQERALNTRLVGAAVSVRLKTPVFGMDALAFDNVEVEASLRNRTLKIKRLVVNGDQFDGNFSGSGVIRDNLSDSPINLNGKLSPQAAFVQGSGVKTSAALLGGSSNAEGQIPVRITGPLGNVRLSF